MKLPSSRSKWGRDELLGLLSVSSTLAGLCVTVVAFENNFEKSRSEVSIVDDMFALCAAAFLICIYLIFWALRTHREHVAETLIMLVDVVFLLAMTSMTVAAFIMIYTIW